MAIHLTVFNMNALMCMCVGTNGDIVYDFMSSLNL